MPSFFIVKHTLAIAITLKEIVPKENSFFHRKSVDAKQTYLNILIQRDNVLSLDRLLRVLTTVMSLRSSMRKSKKLVVNAGKAM